MVWILIRLMNLKRKPATSSTYRWSSKTNRLCNLVFFMIFFSILFNHIFNSKLVRNMCGCVCVCVDVIRENQVVKYQLYGCVYMTNMGKLIIISNWFGRTYLSFRKATRRIVMVVKTNNRSTWTLQYRDRLTYFIIGEIYKRNFFDLWIFPGRKFPNRCPQVSDDTTTKRSSIFKLNHERLRRQEKVAVSCNKQNSNFLRD